MIAPFFGITAVHHAGVVADAPRRGVFVHALASLVFTVRVSTFVAFAFYQVVVAVWLPIVINAFVDESTTLKFRAEGLFGHVASRAVVFIGPARVTFRNE